MPSRLLTILKKLKSLFSVSYREVILKASWGLKTSFCLTMPSRLLTILKN